MVPVKDDATPTARDFDFSSIALLSVAFFFAVLSAAFPSVWTGSDALLLISVTSLVLISLSRELPFQNVIVVATLIASIGSAAAAVCIVTPLPFHLLQYDAFSGPRISHVLPWSVPLVWISVILISRGVARLMLRSRREKSYYGLALLGQTALLALILNLSLEIWATQVKGYWSWLWQLTPEISERSSSSGAPMIYFSASFVVFYFSAWFVVCLIILAMITPWLIRKKPGELTLSYVPLILWLVLQLCFATAAARHGLTLFAGLSVLVGSAIGWLAIRGGR
jgi:uncharacterized membrane protein